MKKANIIFENGFVCEAMPESNFNADKWASVATKKIVADMAASIDRNMMNSLLGKEEKVVRGEHAFIEQKRLEKGRD